MILPQISHFHKTRNFFKYICNFLDQLLHPYKFYGRNMSRILFFIVATCEPLISPNSAFPLPPFFCFVLFCVFETRCTGCNMKNSLFITFLYPGYSKQALAWIKTNMNLVCQDIRLSNNNRAVHSMSTWWNIQGGLVHISTEKSHQLGYIYTTLLIF